MMLKVCDDITSKGTALSQRATALRHTPPQAPSLMALAQKDRFKFQEIFNIF